MTIPAARRDAEAAIWHDLECGAYAEDLPLWRALAADAGGPVLDVGAGTGRVTLDLARRGSRWWGSTSNPRWSTSSPAAGPGCRSARSPPTSGSCPLDDRFALIVVPMQTLQLLGGAAGARRSSGGPRPPCAGGLLAAALADAVDCFDDEHALLPPPDECERGGVGSSAAGRGRRRGQSRRTAPHPRDRPRRAARVRRVVVRLDRVDPSIVEAEASALGFAVEPAGCIPETEAYLGATVVMLRRER